MSYVLVRDFEKCTGCDICEVVCSLYHNQECNPSKSLMRVVKIEQRDGNTMCVPISCMQCEKGVCQMACPVTGAIYVSPDTGAKLVNGDRCIGCSACVYTCPFGAMAIDRVKKVAVTCDLCGGDPLCVKFCPTGALLYLSSEEVSIKLMTAKVNRFLETQLPHPEDKASTVKI